MNNWDNDNEWFFNHFDKGVKRATWLVVLVFVLNLLFWLAIIAAIVAGLVIVL